MKEEVPSHDQAGTANFLPHRGAMCLVREFLEFDRSNEHALLRFTLKSDMVCARPDGSLDTTWYVEILAQAAAALFYFQSGGSGKPRMGFLVGIEEMDIADDQMTLGESILVSAKMITEFYPFGVYEVSARKGDVTTARGEFRFMVHPTHDTGLSAA